MCRDFKKGSCKFTSEECWYSHEDEDVSVEEEIKTNQDSVFQKANMNLHPPDLIVKIVNMLQLLTGKISSLEKAQFNQ